jgi:uncharacterized protein YbaP (TraB family)
MPMKSRFASLLLIAIGLVCMSDARAKCCVWSVTGPGGEMLYLGGSFHALRPIDYPLPPEYNRAFDISSRIVFEEDPKTGSAGFKALMKAGQYAKNDSIKNHVDPRTYDYLKRFFQLRGVSEEKFKEYRPWLIDLLLSAPPPEYSKLGVETFFWRRAVANSKRTSGLESTSEHNHVFAGLNDRESEALLLTLFINAGREQPHGAMVFQAWRSGDAETLGRLTRDSFSDFPAMAVRLLDARNRNWIPKIESYLRSGERYFVIVGAAHMGGPNGLLALLKARGCKIEQL